MIHEHPEVETLSAYADGDLSGAALLRAERHLGECASCRETVNRVRALVRDAAALPPAAPPPRAVWDGIRGRLHTRRRSRVWMRVAFGAAAAGVVLVAGTLLSRPDRSAKVRSMTGPVAVPAALITVDRNYQPSIAELRHTLDQQRETLSPATVQVVERSLAVIDAAIAEARAALAADPANHALADILSAQYEHKLDLLQRAAKLSPST